MWRLEKKFRFEASHRLAFHPGKCSRLHGHSWLGAIVCQGDTLHTDGAQKGMIVDFDIMSSVVDELVEAHLDHYHLNESTGLEAPTSEELCRWIYNKLQGKIPMLKSVVIEETCTCRCEYTP